MHLHTFFGPENVLRASQTSFDEKKGAQERRAALADPQWPIVDLRVPQSHRRSGLPSPTTSPFKLRSKSLAEDVDALARYETLGSGSATGRRALGGMNISQGVIAQPATSHDGMIPMERFIAETYGIDIRTKEAGKIDENQAPTSCGAVASSRDGGEDLHH